MVRRQEKPRNENASPALEEEPRPQLEESPVQQLARTAPEGRVNKTEGEREEVWDRPGKLLWEEEVSLKTPGGWPFLSFMFFFF